VWGSAPPPLSDGAFHMTATVTSLPLSKFAGQVPPLLPSLASLFIYSSHEGVPLPHSPELRAPHPLCYFFFFSCLFIIQFFFSLFFPGWGSVCPGAMLICTRVIYGSNACHLAHLRVCQAGSELASGSAAALLVSLFNVEWGCYV
jgi:hypothetical protein